MKDELGWRDFMVRSDRAICRHWALVCCAFAFCWWHEAAGVRLHQAVMPPAPARKKNQAASSTHAMLLAAPAARRAGLADTAAAVMRHGSSTVDCEQIKGCLSTSWHGTSR